MKEIVNSIEEDYAFLAKAKEANMKKSLLSIFICSLSIVVFIGCDTPPKEPTTIEVATKCEGRSCPKNWSNENLDVLSCGRDANDAAFNISRLDVNDALRDKVSDACDLKCSTRSGCATSDSCVEQSNNISAGALLAPGWSCSLVGPDDACQGSEKMYRCTGKYDTLRGNVFCKCVTKDVTAMLIEHSN